MKTTGTILDYLHNSGEGQSAFRSGEDAQHDRGIMYKAPWEHEADGFSEHSRRCVRALASTEIPVQLRGFVSHHYDRFMPEEIRVLLSTSIRRYSVEVYQMISNGHNLYNLTGYTSAAQFQVFLSEEELRALNTFRVFYSVWERDRVSPGLAKTINLFGQVWVGCHQSKRTLVSSGVDESKIFVVPVPHFPDDPLLKVYESKGLKPRRPGPPRFYHIGKWEPRKAQDRLLTAFLKAFRPGEAHLFMKVSRLRTKVEDYPLWVDEALRTAFQDEAVQANGWTELNWKKNIQLTDAFFSQEKITKLHEYGDVYVTLSHGEGFDMPAYDAKIVGNLMLYTPSGGPQDFASREDILVPHKRTIPCSKFYEWEEDACYWDHDDTDAIAGFRAARDKIVAGFRSERDLCIFTAEFVGKQMLFHLEDLVSKHGGRLS